MEILLVIYLAFCPVCRETYSKELQMKGLSQNINVEFVECPKCKKLNLGTAKKIYSNQNNEKVLVYDSESN